MPVLGVLLLALAHNQNYDVTNCVHQNGTIDVGSASLSNSFHVENSLCTFVVRASHVDAISVSRVAPGTGGYVKVRTMVRHELPASASAEPFAIVPLYNTIDMKRTETSGTVYVSMPGRALVSFGVREDYRLIFGQVVPDAYETRSFVYGAPSTVMYLIHSFMFVTVALSCNKKACKVWIILSFIIDCMVWTVWVWSYRTGGTPFFLGVFLARVALLVYVWWSMSSNNKNACCSKDVTGVVFASIVAGVLAWSNVTTIWIALLAVAILVSSCFVSWCSALLLLGGIVLNLGMGLLPWLVWRCTHKYSHGILLDALLVILFVLNVL